MNRATVTIVDKTLAEDVTALLAALDPSDLPKLDRAARGMSGFAAFAHSFLGGSAVGPDRDITRQVIAQGETIDRICDEISSLSKALADLAAKVQAPAPVVATNPQPALESSGACSTVAAVTEVRAPAPTTAPPANSDPSDNRIKIARALANGPMQAADVMRATGIPKGTISHLMANRDELWWCKVNYSELRSPYQLTGAGLQALRDAGYIVPEKTSTTLEPLPVQRNTVAAGDDEPSPLIASLAAELTAAGETEPEDDEDDDVDDTSPEAIVRCQLVDIAKAIRDAKEPISADEIGIRTDLPLDIVRRHLADRSSTAPTAPVRLFVPLGHTGNWKLTNAGYTLALEVTNG